MSSVYTQVPHLLTLRSSSKYLGKPWKTSLLSAYSIEEIRKESPTWHFFQPQTNFVPQKLKTPWMSPCQTSPRDKSGGGSPSIQNDLGAEELWSKGCKKLWVRVRERERERCGTQWRETASPDWLGNTSKVGIATEMEQSLPHIPSV